MCLCVCADVCLYTNRMSVSSPRENMDFDDVIYVSCDVLQTFSCQALRFHIGTNACDNEVRLIMGDLGDAFITWALKGEVHPKKKTQSLPTPPSATGESGELL